MLTQAEVFKLFGHISVFYSTWDTMIGYFLHKVVNEDYKSKNPPPKKNSTIGQKLDFISNLEDNDVISIEAIKFVRGFLDQAKAISRERNRFIHDNWMFSPEDLAKGRIARMPLYFDKSWELIGDKPVYYSMNELEQLLVQLGDMQKKFTKAAGLV